MVKPSLAAFVEHPFGFTLGDINDTANQFNILKSTLLLACRSHKPGTIISLPFKWTKDNLRDMQLQKKRK